MRHGKAHVPFPSGPAGSAATRLTSENVPWPTSSSTSYRSVPGIRSSNMAEGQRGRPCIGSRGEGGGVAVSVGCRDAAFYGCIGSPLWLSAPERPGVQGQVGRQSGGLTWIPWDRSQVLICCQDEMKVI